MTIESILSPGMIERYTRDGSWGTRIWPDYIEQTTKKAPGRLAIVDTRGSIDYATFWNLTGRLGLHLMELGIGREDRVGIQLPNWREFLIARFALARIGAIAVPLPVDWRAKEVEYVLAATEAAGVITAPKFGSRNYLDEHDAMKAAVPSLRVRLLARTKDVPAGWLSLDRYLDDPIEQRTPPEKLASARAGANDVDLVVSTSGTSAAPKLVVRTPNCFLATTHMFTDHRGDMTGDDVVACLAPIARGMGYFIGVAASIVSGCSMSLLEKFDAEQALQWLVDTKATIAVAVPTQLIKMLQVEDFDKYDLSRLRMIVNGGAACPPSIARETEKRFGCVLLTAYGSVEGATPTCTAPSDPPELRYTTVGRAMPGMDLRIANDDGSFVPQGGIGEVVYKGPGLSLGLWRNSAEYRKLFNEQGYFGTGDLGTLDEKGFLRIVGRKKEIIIRGGINISPAEVEGLLMECPGVRQVCVVKMPDPVLGERCCAYIVPAKGADLSVAVLAKFLDEREVAKYKFPERVELRDQLPMTPDGGKVLRRALEEDIAHLLSQETKSRA
jgi:acyl-CoA synthetase (AMP-forming)/AMP-acid ligase II